MTKHSIAFEIERPVPAGEAVGELRPANPDDAGTVVVAPAPLELKKFNFRKLLMAGAAIAVLAGAGWYGVDYFTEIGRAHV